MIKEAYEAGQIKAAARLEKLMGPAAMPLALGSAGAAVGAIAGALMGGGAVAYNRFKD